MNVKAKSISAGDCFRKKTGAFGYIRISESAVKHFGLNPNMVYGVTSNGNMTSVDLEKTVVFVPMETFFVAKQQEEEFDRTFAKKQSVA